jgi:hypothetical protein
MLAADQPTEGPRMAAKQSKRNYYKPEFCEKAKNLALLGASDVQLAAALNVSVSALNVWKKKYPEFLEAIQAGKIIADANVGGSLYKMATGYVRTETDIRVVQGKIVQTEIEKFYPPSFPAIAFYLTNRQRETWRHHQELEHSGAIAASDMSDDQLNAKMVALAKELGIDLATLMGGTE